MLKYDLPENKGVMNGLKRAKQFTELWYSGAASFPCCYILSPYNTVKKEFYNATQEAGFPKKGLPYSSAIKHQKLIGYHVSIESFMTALRDPESILYTQTLIGGERKNAAAWYGTVCSSLVSYTWDLPIQHTCGNWHEMPDVECLGQPDLDELRLLDVVLNKTHITTVTGIMRDEKGAVKKIEISESTLPNCRSTWFNPDEFRLYWYQNRFAPYYVWRRKDQSGIKYIPSPFVHIEADPERGIEGDPELPEYQYNAAIVPSHGNRSNYLLETEPVILDILDEKWTSVKITGEDGQSAVYQVENLKVQPVNQNPGYYKAVAMTDAGECSLPAEYAVAAYGEPLDTTVYAPGEEMTISLIPGRKADRPLYYSFAQTSDCVTVAREVLTDEEVKQGFAKVTAPEKAGDYYLALGTQNEFGVYASVNYLFTVKE